MNAPLLVPNQSAVATGMANTANMGAITGAPGPDQHAADVEEVSKRIIATGVALMPTGADDPNTKSFYSRFAGSNTTLPDGTSITFNAIKDAHGSWIGVFRTDDPVAIKELNKIVDKPGTHIFSKADLPEDSLAKLAASQNEQNAKTQAVGE
jgi:hypothetical protein